MRKRTQARDMALKILYQTDMTGKSVATTVEEFFNNEPVADEDILSFSKRLVFGVGENKAAIDAKIAQYAANWELKRMAVIDRNILRLGVFELQYAADVPPKVTINEAVELAKRYGDLDSSKFVNGVLDKIHKTETVLQQKKS